MTAVSQAPVPGSSYILPADEDEGHRLQVQHDLYKRKVYDNRLTGTVELKPDDYVLDIGTGSGAWVTDVAKDAPAGVHFDAIDVSSKLFPKEHPPSITFAAKSVTSLPPEWTGRFALVHQRLLIAGLLATEWPVAITEIFRVLQPGGVALVVELAARCTDTELAARHEAATRALYAEKKLLRDCGAELPRFLHEAGFVDIHPESKLIPVGRGGGADGLIAKVAFGGAYRGMKAPLVRAGGFGFINSEREYDEMVEAVEAEWDEGEATPYFVWVIHARKPIL